MIEETKHIAAVRFTKVGKLYHFDATKNDNTKSPEYKGMKESYNRFPEDFSLSEGN